MRVTLIYNPHAGGIGDLSSDKLLEALSNAGYTPMYQATQSEDDLDHALVAAEDLVVVAGGDGTLRAVATRLIERQVKVFPLPLGTANNVCKALNIRGSALELIDGLKEPATRPLDLGHVQGPWGEGYFLEAAGLGLFAESLANYRPEEGKSVFRAIGALVETLAKHRSRHWHITLDGHDISGEYLMVEVLNTPATGSRLRLAPNADPGDGLLNVVCIEEHSRDNLLTYAKATFNEELAGLSSVDVHRGKHLELVWDGFPIHLDAKVPSYQRSSPKHPSNDYEAGMVYIDVLPNALGVWLPERLLERTQDKL
jgi:diacylglycerol kinase (ATP)